MVYTFAVNIMHTRSYSNVGDYISHLSIDCVIFGYSDQALKVLIPKFKFGQQLWILPGGHIFKSEGIDQAAARILEERTGLTNIYLEQFRVFGAENRIISSPDVEMMRTELPLYDPKRFTPETVAWLTHRNISIGYYALVDINKVHPKVSEFDEYVEWRNVDDLPQMIYDHKDILTAALMALREHLDEKLIAFNLLPETFTMRELLELYEAVYNRPVAMNNFQKKMLDLKVLERLEKKYTGARNKAPYLYRLVQRPPDNTNSLTSEQETNSFSATL